MTQQKEALSQIPRTLLLYNSGNTPKPVYGEYQNHLRTFIRITDIRIYSPRVSQRLTFVKKKKKNFLDEIYIKSIQPSYYCDSSNL